MKRVSLLVEVARPVTLMLCLVALYAVFHAAFLEPAAEVRDRAWDGAGLLVLAAVLCGVSGWIFREPGDAGGRRVGLVSTLPVRVFLWAAGAMGVLFAASWYLEAYCVFYREVRF